MTVCLLRCSPGIVPGNNHFEVALLAVLVLGLFVPCQGNDAVSGLLPLR